RWWFNFYFSGKNEGNNQRGLYADAIGSAMGQIRAQVRDEFRRADEEMQRTFEAKLAEGAPSGVEQSGGRVAGAVARTAVRGAKAHSRGTGKCVRSGNREAGAAPQGAAR